MLTHLYYLTVTDDSKKLEYTNLGVFDDHQGTVTAIKLIAERNAQGRRRLRLMSVGTDKHLVVR